MKLTKGDKVYMFIKWDSSGACVYRPATVKSCGSKQMTLEVDASGKMLKHFIYPGDTFNNYESTLLASQFADEAAVIQKALEFSKSFIEFDIKHYEDLIAAYENESYGYLKLITDDLKKLQATEPSAKTYNQAMEEIYIKMKINKNKA